MKVENVPLASFMDTLAEDLSNKSRSDLRARIEALEAENARLRNVIVDAIEIINDELPGEFDVWVIAASAALKGGE